MIDESFNFLEGGTLAWFFLGSTFHIFQNCVKFFLDVI